VVVIAEAVTEEVVTKVVVTTNAAVEIVRVDQAVRVVDKAVIVQVAVIVQAVQEEDNRIIKVETDIV